ncbi:Hypothetical protein D9617_5g071160 [Elsinoe fawcettii]|nr:Hypothetical protein D9617_5g071160 [Elsinoe fawcettii]
MAETTGVHKLPRVAITYCTQCRWMLRAAYFGQELLSTFSTAIGEIALIPATGGIFQVHLTYTPKANATVEGQNPHVQNVLLWDRKAEGGFPETKILKQQLRNYIEPDRDLGHSDKPSNKSSKAEDVKANDTAATAPAPSNNAPSADCEDCK